MTNDEKCKLRSVFFTWVIKDPYPEVTEYNRFPEHKTKPEVSVHKAWQEGYEFAKNLVLKKLEEF
jgi:hypothetical protein